MKKIFLLLLLLQCVVFGGTKTKINYAMQGQEGTSQLLNETLAQAIDLIDGLNLKKSDLQHTIEFMEFYASWYAPVTPAPYTLKDSLSSDAQKFIKNIKNIARVFERSEPQRPSRLGASRLTPDGKKFYRIILSLLKEKSIAKSYKYSFRKK